MGRRRYSEQERKQWVARWRASGKSARAFAERHGLSAVTLYGWARTAREQAELQGFVEVQLPQVAEVTRATLGSIEIELAGGRVVRIREQVDFALLRAVLDVLESQC